MAIRIAVHGAAGRMGRRLLALCAADEQLELAAAVERDGHPMVGQPVAQVAPDVEDELQIVSSLPPGVEVAVDFSTPEGTVALLSAASEAKTALVVGTTGLDARATQAVRDAADTIPVLWAPNMSMGVNLLLRVAAQVAQVLGDAYNVEIVDAHHNRKADAPSGTALALARVIAEALGRDPDADLAYGRHGRTGPRKKEEIGVHALRMGGVVGEHTIHFASDAERIELTHRVQNRDVFAAGALRAAKWVHDREPGLYTMQNALFGD